MDQESITDTAMPLLSPARIMEVGLGFWPAKVLLSALEIQLFTVLGGKAMTGAELQRALELHPRANPDFFDALLALSFLEQWRKVGTFNLLAFRSGHG